MAQYDFQIADYERIFRKRYKIVLAAVAFAVIFSVMFARMKPSIYSATATVKVDRNSVMGLGVEAFMYGTWDNIETQTKVITSFPVLLRVAKKLRDQNGKPLVADSVDENIHPSDENVLSTLASLKGKITTSVSSGTNIITISTKSTSAKDARDLANATAFAYKDFSIFGKKMHATQTKEFVKEQLDECKAELSEIEQTLQEFEETQQVPSIDANSTRIIRQSTEVQGKLSDVGNAIEVISIQKNKLQDRLRSKSFTRSIPGDEAIIEDTLAMASRMGWISEFTDDDPGLIKLNSRLIQFQIELDEQLAFYKPGHPSIGSIQKNISGTIEQILDEYTKKLSQLKAEETKLTEQKETIEQELAQMPANEMRYARLLRRIKIQEELYGMLVQKHQEALIAAAGVVDDITVMSLATLPGAPTNKNVLRVAGMGIFLGLLFGIILAIVREMLDTSIGTIEDVERTLKLAVLAVIPHINTDETKGQKQKRRKDKAGAAPTAIHQSTLVTHFNPKDPTAEAYRIMRTNIEYLMFEKKLITILLTSATMQEGKSTTIANLAVAFAQQGKRVLLLECNLRRPSLQKVFGLDKHPGTSDILVGKSKWQDCVRTVTDLALGQFTMEEILAIPGLDNFNIISYGHRPPNPTELLSSLRMDTLLKELRENFDLVLVDAPPLLPVADSMVLSKKVDGVGLVYMVGKAPRNSLRLAKERLETVQANILGLVLNNIRPETTGLIYSSYSMYSYSKDTKKKKSRFSIL